MRQRNGGTDSRHRFSNMELQVVLAIHVHLFFEKVKNPWSAWCASKRTNGGRQYDVSKKLRVRVQQRVVSAWAPCQRASTNDNPGAMSTCRLDVTHNS